VGGRYNIPAQQTGAVHEGEGQDEMSKRPRFMPADLRLSEKILVPVTREARRAVEDLATEERVTMAEIARRALNHYLKHRRDGVAGEV